uniref:Uncharacterized protein n=1 Tax=Glossina austeni TaxID=7395 RepID=A0A1A9VDL3_GLOAU
MPLLQHTEDDIRSMYDINVLTQFWVNAQIFIASTRTTSQPCRQYQHVSDLNVAHIVNRPEPRTVSMLQVFLPDMIRQNRGHIAALSACAGLFGLNNLAPSCDTKYAVRGFMKAMTEELSYLNPKNQPQETVAFVIKTQRTGLEEISVPRDYFIIEKCSNLFPHEAVLSLRDFLDIGIDSNF